MGGSDQWGNIITGTELIRRKAGGEAFAFTCPLITKADGGSLAKPKKAISGLMLQRHLLTIFTSSGLMQVMTDAEKWIRIFTFLIEPR